MSATQVREQIEKRAEILALVEESGGSMSFAEIGRRVGVSRERVRKIVRSRGSLARKREKRKELICPECGKVFTAWPSRIKGGRRFCSCQCAQRARWRGGKSPILVFKCEVCGQSYARKLYQLRGRPPRFCSRQCQGKWVGSNFGAKRARVPVSPSG